MRVARSLPEIRALRKELAGTGRLLALVPTMGALHAGHAALVAAARERGAATVASIFVNPIQFGAGEGYENYPRDEVADLAALRAAHCDLVWLPSVETMYPRGDASKVDVTGPALRWEGDARPGHFRGVATVVVKLFGQIHPDLAMFGEKDWQQLQVVRRITSDLHLDVDVIAVPTVRRPDGLALSSRNRFLTASDQKRAPVLYATLARAGAELRSGASIQGVLVAARTSLARAGFAIDYLALVDAQSLAPLDVVRAPARLIAAATLGAVRLLDNVAVA